MIGPRLALLAFAASLLAVPAGAQSRARVTFANERVYTGVLSVDASGELVLDCDRLGGPAAIDFPKVRRLELLEDEPVPDLSTTDVMTVVGAERYLGELTGVIGESVTFRSAKLGDITVPRDLVGDVRPRGAAPVAAPGRRSGAAHGPVGGLVGARRRRSRGGLGRRPPAGEDASRLPDGGLRREPRRHRSCAGRASRSSASTSAV